MKYILLFTVQEDMFSCLDEEYQIFDSLNELYNSYVYLDPNGIFGKKQVFSLTPAHPSMREGI